MICGDEGPHQSVGCPPHSCTFQGSSARSSSISSTSQTGQVHGTAWPDGKTGSLAGRTNTYRMASAGKAPSEPHWAGNVPAQTRSSSSFQESHGRHHRQESRAIGLHTRATQSKPATANSSWGAHPSTCFHPRPCRHLVIARQKALWPNSSRANSSPALLGTTALYAVGDWRQAEQGGTGQAHELTVW